MSRGSGAGARGPLPPVGWLRGKRRQTGGTRDGGDAWWLLRGPLVFVLDGSDEAIFSLPWWVSGHRVVFE